MSYYPPAQGAYGYPGYPPQQQYAAGAPVGYPPAQPGYPSYPPQSGPPPPGQPGYGYPAPAPYGYPATGAPTSAPAPYGYSAPGAPPPAPYGYPAPAAGAHPPPLQHAPTMATNHSIPHTPTMTPASTMVHAPTMPMGQPNYFQPVAGLPTPQQDAETIHSACKGFGTDEKRVISVVAARPPEHLAVVTSVYKQFYGRDLVEVLDSETSGNFGRTLHYLILPPFVLDAELIYHACIGAGTNERCLIQTLVGRTNAEMAQLKHTFQARYHRSLESVVKNDVSGYFEKLLVICIQGTRDETGHYSYSVEADTQALYKAGEGRLGTDESQFVHILTNRPDVHLRLVFKQYESRYGKKFTKVIKKEFSGWIETALVYLAEWIENPALCVAKNMEKAMEGAGTDDHSLIRLVVRNRSPAFMTQIKAAYAAKYKKSLRDRIKGETSGDYRRALFTAIGEPERS